MAFADEAMRNARRLFVAHSHSVQGLRPADPEDDVLHDPTHSVPPKLESDEQQDDIMSLP